MMRQIGVQPREAPVAAAIKPRDVVVIFVRPLAVDAQVTLAAEFDRRVAHVDADTLPAAVRNRHNSAAASAAAPIVACAAVATAKVDGSTGSVPVK